VRLKGGRQGRERKQKRGQRGILQPRNAKQEGRTGSYKKGTRGEIEKEERVNKPKIRRVKFPTRKVGESKGV